ncbi:hypothetical protein LTR09_002875 [Extremus antarcticus]|uniref:Uncharacterized protein n=1 Tax=Extremus antarcticus TaxID=702011 RepID=A0AAJ0GF70_9PEZI|nr:hypothetical protein LTR09_002875 [Extremus antarcticus]
MAQTLLTCFASVTTAVNSAVAMLKSTLTRHKQKAATGARTRRPPPPPPPSSLDEASQNEAHRLDSLYGSVWPDKCGELEAGWFDRLPPSYFHRHYGQSQSRATQTREMKQVHEARRKVYAEKRARAGVE